MPREILQIRSHHLIPLMHSIAEFYTGDDREFAKKEALLSLSEIKTDPELNTENYYGIGHSYRFDVLGVKDINEQKYQNAIEENVLKIMTLPDDTLVIASNRPDSICQSCAIGVHCDMQAPKGLGGDNNATLLLKLWLSQNQLGFKTINNGVITNMANIRKFLKVDKPH